MSQSWLHRSQSNATFEFGCLWFAFFFVKLEHKKTDDYLKVVLLHAVCGNCSLSINLRLVSINKTHSTVPLLLSVNNHCLTKPRRIQGLSVNKHFLLLFKYLWSAGGWGLAMWYVMCGMWHVIPCFTFRQWTGYWLSWWNRLVMCLLFFSSPPCITGRMTLPSPCFNQPKMSMS